MGIGRFAYTPILPLMTAQAGLTAKAGASLATANYVGYLAGALAGTVSSRVARSHLAIRSSLVLLVVTLVAMPLGDAQTWIAMRLLAGFTSAVVFVGAVNWMADHLHGHSPYLTGWGFGGVGVGIALSGSLVLLLPGAAGWQSAWWVAGGLAAVLSLGAWAMRPRAGAGPATPSAPCPARPRESPPVRRSPALLHAGGNRVHHRRHVHRRGHRARLPWPARKQRVDRRRRRQRLRPRCCGHGWVGASRIRRCWRGRCCCSQAGSFCRPFSAAPPPL